MIRDVGRFHVLKAGHAQICLPQTIARTLPWRNKDQVIIEEQEGVIIIKILNE
ncbi:hypothetical protein ACFLRC_00100 [Candidatus Altiarchaeota archaeon]